MEKNCTKADKTDYPRKMVLTLKAIHKFGFTSKIKIHSVYFMNDLNHKLEMQKELKQMELAANTAYEEVSIVECNKVEVELHDDYIADEKSNWRLPNTQKQ